MQSQSPQRIGLLGGSFDPVHCGHLAIAQLASEHYGLEPVFFIPAFIPPHKQKSVHASVRDRLAMLQRAIIKNKRFAVWEGEIKRKGVSYTIDTVKTMRTLNPEAQLYLIIGSDNLNELLTWKNYHVVISRVTLCVAHRPGYAMRVPSQLSKASIVTFPSPEWGISSTMIRSYVSRNLSCRYLLPQRVYSYISSNGLYRS